VYWKIKIPAADNLGSYDDSFVKKFYTKKANTRSTITGYLLRLKEKKG
jgi:hypothetical protein